MTRRYRCASCAHEYTDHLVTVLCEQLAFCRHSELLEELEELLAGEDAEERLEVVGNLYMALSQQMLRKGFDIDKTPEARAAFKSHLARLREFVTQQQEPTQ